MLLGYNYSISNKNKFGYYVGIDLGSIKGSNYNVNSLNINVGLYNKSIITKQLSNINSFNIVGSKFFIDRYVYKNDYTHINSSIHMGMHYGISSYWKYDFNVLYSNAINYTISPQVNLYLVYINLSSYGEKGLEALNVNEFNSYVSIAKGGMLNTWLINKNSNVKYIFNLSFMGGREYNNLKNTIFNFKDSSVNERCELQEPYNNANYFKISFYFSHVSQDNKLGFNLQCSYKTNKIFNNANIC